MDAFKLILNKILSVRTESELGREVFQKIRFINFFLYFSLLVTVLIGIYNITSADLTASILSIVFTLLLLVSAVYIRLTADISFPGYLFIGIMLFDSLDLIINGGYKFTGPFWIFIFPNLMIFLKGVKKGTALVIVLSGIMILLTVLTSLNIIKTPFTTEELSLIVTIFLFNNLIVIYFHYLLEGNYQMITKQKLLLGELYKVANLEKSKLQTILGSIADGVIVLDASKRIILVNRAVLEISGFTREELLEQVYNHKLKFLFEKDKTENVSFVDDVYKTGQSAKMDSPTILITKNNVEVPVADSSAPIKSETGEVIGNVIVFRDVTEEREVDRMKSEFVSLASHQLKTPLTGLSYLLEILSDKDAQIGDKEKESVKMLKEASDNLARLVDDLLNVSRIEAGRKFDFKPTSFNPLELIEEVIREQQLIAEQKKVTIKLDAKEVLPPISADKDKLFQVFKNLLNNAIKYSKDGSTVEIELLSKGNKVFIKVKDSGIGIPEEAQKHIFEKLYRAGNAQEFDDSGTGLGLYIAKAIVDGHKGSINFESTKDKGTTFTVELPLV